MPQPLFMTIISTGSSLPGRVLQIRQDGEVALGVPASPPMTMVMPSPPCRFCTRAVPGALTHWMSITEHDRHDVPLSPAKWPAKLRPIECGSVAVIAIWRMPSTSGMPMATTVALLR